MLIRIFIIFLITIISVNYIKADTEMISYKQFAATAAELSMEFSNCVKRANSDIDNVENNLKLENKSTPKFSIGYDTSFVENSIQNLRKIYTKYNAIQYCEKSLFLGISNYPPSIILILVKAAYNAARLNRLLFDKKISIEKYNLELISNDQHLVRELDRISFKINARLGGDETTDLQDIEDYANKTIGIELINWAQEQRLISGFKNRVGVHNKPIVISCAHESQLLKCVE